MSNPKPALSSNPTGKTGKRLFGITSIAVLAALLAALLLTLSPAEPRMAKPAETPSMLPTHPASHLPVASTHHTPYGETALIPDLESNPKAATQPDDENARSNPDNAGGDKAAGSPTSRPALFSAKVASARLLSVGAFDEWFPAHVQTGSASPAYPGDEAIVFVEIEVENLGIAPIDLPLPCLRSPLLRGDQSLVGTAILPQTGELAALYGQADNRGIVAIPEDAFAVGPGESRTFPLAFKLYRNQLNDPSMLDSAEAKDFAVAFTDYGELSLYELTLG